ncbi:hypothetical protein SRB521_02451 [Intestinimonas butyriciproducens]|nr:hypothetical protein SRB521_02451 [Intestinimonas butyriciproducens]
MVGLQSDLVRIKKDLMGNKVRFDYTGGRRRMQGRDKKSAPSI